MVESGTAVAVRERMKKAWRASPWVGVIALGAALPVGCSGDGAGQTESSAWTAMVPAAEALSLPSGGFRVAGAKQDSVAEWHGGASLAEGMRVKSSHGPWMTVRRLDALGGAGRLEDGAVMYEGGEVEVRVFATELGVEDLWRFHEPRTEWGYELELPQGYRLHEVESVPGLVEVRDERGTSRMRVHARAAWDARGREVPVEVEVEGNRLVVGVRDVEAWPVVVDPEWTDSGVMLYGRDGATLSNASCNGKGLGGGG